MAFLALLQTLGPLLHAHAGGQDGAVHGLHQHLLAGQQTAHHSAPAATPQSLTPEEGAAVFVTAGFRGDTQLQALLTDRSSITVFPPAEAAVATALWPAHRSQAPPPPPHLRPAATAPPSR